ncbi:uncharacterized protein A4U43_C02F8740 [Asparagus officinalis]|uniref:Uncharacterized protein n=1 Tax=Asparagus officinalis TaxID=4686 RepID=A0A5P1FIU4_ASPOF|nr:uncharacterized protein A4U43_C02F8740 [Asparagus officinalis]
MEAAIAGAPPTKVGEGKGPLFGGDLLSLELKEFVRVEQTEKAGALRQVGKKSKRYKLGRKSKCVVSKRPRPRHELSASTADTLLSPVISAKSTVVLGSVIEVEVAVAIDLTVGASLVVMTSYTSRVGTQVSSLPIVTIDPTTRTLHVATAIEIFTLPLVSIQATPSSTG